MDILQLDVRGHPQRWISLETAATHLATDGVAWAEGQGPLVTLHGGFNAARGRRSVIEIYPILALRGVARRDPFAIAPAFRRAKLFRRDRFTCAYCGGRFPELALSCDHILPRSRGGRWTWMNLVAACGACNRRKADRTPDEARMPLLFLPYVPSPFEDLLLQGRGIRADVHDWLAARLPKASRLC